MSRVRGVFPLFLVTALGIVNGIWVFGPALKEQSQEKQELERKAQELARLYRDEELETLRDAEAAASRTTTKESTLKKHDESNSWWLNLGLWSKDTTSTRKPHETAPSNPDPGKMKK